jgi:hypothetical protein
MAQFAAMACKGGACLPCKGPLHRSEGTKVEGPLLALENHTKAQTAYSPELNPRIAPQIEP